MRKATSGIVIALLCMGAAYALHRFTRTKLHSVELQDSEANRKTKEPSKVIGSEKPINGPERNSELRRQLAQSPSKLAPEELQKYPAECRDDWQDIIMQDPVTLQDRSASGHFAVSDECGEWMSWHQLQCQLACPEQTNKDACLVEIFSCRARIMNAVYSGSAKDLETPVLFNIAYALGNSSVKDEQYRLIEVGKELDKRNSNDVFGLQLALNAFGRLGLQFHEKIDLEAYADVRDRLVALTELQGKPEEALSIKVAGYFGLVSDELKDFSQAKREIELFQEQYPQSGKGYYMEAWNSYLQGDQGRAATLLKKAYQLSPESRDIKESYETLMKENALRFLLMGNSLDFSLL